MQSGETMTTKISVRHDGQEKEVKLTDDVRDSLNDAGATFISKSERALRQRVEELLYNIAEVKPRGARRRTEVVVTDHEGDGSLDHGQPTKIDEADDVEFRMIRPDGITVGWSDDE